jgi:hypothetical protein
MREKRKLAGLRSLRHHAQLLVGRIFMRRFVAIGCLLGLAAHAQLACAAAEP